MLKKSCYKIYITYCKINKSSNLKYWLTSEPSGALHFTTQETQLAKTISCATKRNNNGLLLHIHRTMHVVIDRQTNHGTHFHVLVKALCLYGGDHIHAGTIVGKLEGERQVTLGFFDLLSDDYIEKVQSHGIYFTQDWVSLPCALLVASEGIHVWHMRVLIEIFGDDFVLQFGGGTLGHSWGNALG